MHLIVVISGTRIATPSSDEVSATGKEDDNREGAGGGRAARRSGQRRGMARRGILAASRYVPRSGYPVGTNFAPHARISEFVSVSEPLAWSGCGDVRPPEALLTPDPMLQVQDDDLHARVSFIVGSDGHVHSPFILDSGGPEEDQLILRAVRRWRYCPALCNGVPTDSEARVRFAPR